MYDFLKFLHKKRELIIFSFVSFALQTLVCFLYNKLWTAVIYALFLQGLILLLILGFGFYRYKKRMEALKEFEQALFESDELLPAPDNETEAQYQRLLVQAREIYDQKRREEAAEHNENLNYYTLWVHQMKTPIAAMRLLLSEDVEKDACLKQEVFKVERYAELVLKYMKLRDISSDLVIERCALNPLVKECVKKYALLFVYQRLSVNIAPFDLMVDSDAKWLSFIIEQILSNAVKYTKKGSVTIVCEAGELVFSDTGVGIRSEDVPRVFEKGYTGYNGRVDGRASGIGLYLAKCAADSLNIKITLTSKLNQGTKVRLHFPERFE